MILAFADEALHLVLAPAFHESDPELVARLRQTPLNGEAESIIQSGWVVSDEAVGPNLP